MYPGIALVTGATGFIGRHLVERLATRGTRIRATGRTVRDDFFDRLGVEFVPADVSLPHTLPPLFEGDVDRIFHLGAVCNFSTPYAELEPINVRGVENITALCLQAGVKRFIHVSSTSVYGAYQGTPFTESSPRNPQDNYGLSKRNGENVLLRRIEEGLPVTLLRPSTVYGPGCNDGAGKAFSRPTNITAIPGSGNQLLSNVRVEDVAEAAIYLSEREDTLNQTYNVSDGSYPTVEEALTLAAEVFVMKIPKMHVPLALARAMARLGGMVSRRKGQVPDLEYDALRYLDTDYVVDITKLLSTGYRLVYPDFRASLRSLGENQPG